MFGRTVTSYGKELSAPRPNPKLEDYPLSSVRNFLFNMFAATLLYSSIRNLRTRHAVVTDTHLSRYTSNKHTKIYLI
jgi:hypothetical protein